MVDEVYAADISRIPLLSRHEKKEIDYILSNGSTPEQKAEARQKLVLSCLRIAVDMAGKYKQMHPKQEYTEILQLCNLALVTAGKYYKPNKGANFATYAKRCIRRNVWCELGKRNARNKIYAFSIDLRSDENEPTLGEILEDPKAEQPLDALEKRDLEKMLHSFLDDFKDKKRTVAILRAQGYTLQETITFVEICRERARQVEKEVIKTLKKRMQYKTA